MSTSNQPGDHAFYSWLGGTEPYLDQPHIVECGRLVLGAYGGNTGSGANKNEDAALVFADPDGEWEFAMIVDAHYSSESARLLLDLVTGQRDAIRQILDDAPFERLFRELEDHIVSVFSSPAALSRAIEVEGEASCLICVRCNRFVWWMNVGDCLAFLFHREFAARNQYALNQRSYFEWIGYRNTFANAVPCYASGVRELFVGRSALCLATDGVFEGDRKPLVSPRELYQAYMLTAARGVSTLATRTRLVLDRIHHLKGRDSATIIVWNCPEVV